jgi:OOP family OmpA-OmpF porin
MLRMIRQHACARRHVLWIALLVGAWSSNAWTQDLQPRIAEAQKVLAAARAQQVDVLSPRNFQRAAQAVESAQVDAGKGAKPARVQTELDDFHQAADAASRAADLARALLAGTLKTRADAITADAARNAPELWQRAAERFNEAALELEKSDQKSAQKHAAEAEVLFRESELAAIKGGLLNGARVLIQQADEAKAGKQAPRTLEAAKKYLAQAETEINQNRYDADLPRSLAQQAAYEARHAIYLSKLIKNTQAQDQGLEALILAWEEPLRRIAAQVDLNARFDESFEKPMQELLDHVNAQQQNTHDLQQDLADRDGQIVALNTEIKRLEDRLGGVSQERIALQRRIDAQAQVRSNLLKVETMFTPAEARIFRQSDDVVISLMGLNFPSGKSTMEQTSSVLLGKVQQALALFPTASIVVEGHTDSYGSDSANMLLSQDRADAIKQYLISTVHVNAEKINSIGYGETRPVATNDTSEGRARNRRIDLVLKLPPTEG